MRNPGEHHWWRQRTLTSLPPFPSALRRGGLAVGGNRLGVCQPELELADQFRPKFQERGSQAIHGRPGSDTDTDIVF